MLWKNSKTIYIYCKYIRSVERGRNHTDEMELVGLTPDLFFYPTFQRPILGFGAKPQVPKRHKKNHPSKFDRYEDGFKTSKPLGVA